MEFKYSNLPTKFLLFLDIEHPDYRMVWKLLQDYDVDTQFSYYKEVARNVWKSDKIYLSFENFLSQNNYIQEVKISNNSLIDFAIIYRYDETYNIPLIELLDHTSELGYSSDHELTIKQLTDNKIISWVGKNSMSLVRLFRFWDKRWRIEILDMKQTGEEGSIEYSGLINEDVMFELIRKQNLGFLENYTSR